MKLGAKSLVVALGLASAAMISGCATPEPVGLLCTQTTQPVTVGNGEIKYAKTGEASCYSLCGIFAWGDSSINAACKNANIRKVGWASKRVNNIFGVYGVYTTIVFGETGE